MASFARQDCGKSLWTVRALVHRFLSHEEEHGEQEPVASRWKTQLCDTSLAEPGPPLTEAGMSEGLFGLNQRRQVPVDTNGWQR